jgi:hypothetical protein
MPFSAGIDDNIAAFIRAEYRSITINDGPNLGAMGENLDRSHFLDTFWKHSWWTSSKE